MQYLVTIEAQSGARLRFTNFAAVLPAGHRRVCSGQSPALASVVHYLQLEDGVRCSYRGNLGA